MKNTRSHHEDIAKTSLNYHITIKGSSIVYPGGIGELSKSHREITDNMNIREFLGFFEKK